METYSKITSEFNKLPKITDFKSVYFLAQQAFENGFRAGTLTELVSYLSESLPEDLVRSEFIYEEANPGIPLVDPGRKASMFAPAGTYTIPGGTLELHKNFNVIGWNGSTWVKLFEADIEVIPPENKIPVWESGTYNQGDQRIHNGQIWSVAVPSTTEEPGTGEDWESITDKGNEMDVEGGALSFEIGSAAMNDEMRFGFPVENVSINVNGIMNTNNPDADMTDYIFLNEGDELTIGIKSTLSGVSGLTLYDLKKDWIKSIYSQNEISPGNSFGTAKYVAESKCYVRGCTRKTTEIEGEPFVQVRRTASSVVPNTGRAVNSDAVLGFLFEKNDIEFSEIKPLFIDYNKSFSGTGVVDDTTTDIYYYNFDRDYYVSANPLDSVDRQKVRLLSSNMGRRTDLNLLDLNTDNKRVRIPYDQAQEQFNPYFAVTIRKSDAGAKMEINTAYEPTIKTEIVKKQMGLPLPLVKISEYSDEYDIHYYAVDGGKVYVTMDMDVPSGQSIAIVYDSAFNPVKDLTSETANFRGKNVTGAIVDLDLLYPRYIDVSYIGIIVKKNDNSATVTGEVKGAYPYKFKYFKTSSFLPKNQGVYLRDFAIKPDGTLEPEEGIDTYYIRKNSLQNGKLVLYSNVNQPYPYASITNADKELITSIPLTNSYEGNTFLLDEIEGTYIGFSFNRNIVNNFVLSGYIREDFQTDTYNFLDYINEAERLHSQNKSFQALMDLVHENGGGTIYLPDGTYYFTGPVIPRNNVSIRGESRLGTIIKPIGTLSAFRGVMNQNQDLIEPTYNITYENFTIDGELQVLGTSGYDPFKKGIYIQKVINCTFRNLLIKNTGSTGFGVDHFQNTVIDNVLAFNCGRLNQLEIGVAPGASGIGLGTGAFKTGHESLTVVNCHANNNGQNGIFIEKNGASLPVGISVIGCTAEGNRIGFGCSGNDGLVFIGCTAFRNHHAGFTFDHGTMGSTSTKGTRVKYIGCISKENGRDLPDGYPEYQDNPNGFGWFIESDLDGFEMTNCDATNNLKDGIHVKAGMTNFFISGGNIRDNGESGINLNGHVKKFRISPSVSENNTGDGLRINGDLSNGLIKDGIYTANANGINKISGVMTNCIVKDNLSFGNIGQDLINIEQS